MKRRQRKLQRKLKNQYTLYSAVTEPMLPSITTPIPRIALSHEPWIRRALHGIASFFASLIKKINQLLALALAVLLLLLFTRFVLYFFHLTTSQFSYWVFLLSTPLVAPFENLLPPLPYKGYTIDVSTLIAILGYALAVTIVRQFLKLLVVRPS
jgi:uncharacterized protein YggT (Ycf19 family)